MIQNINQSNQVYIMCRTTKTENLLIHREQHQVFDSTVMEDFHPITRLTDRCFMVNH